MNEPGDIVTVWFPFSRMEAEPYKKRPVLVLGMAGSGDDQSILVTMITSNKRRVVHPHDDDVVVDDYISSGLPLPSVVRATRLWTAQSRDVAGALGKVDAQTLAAVRSRIAILLNM